MYIRFKQHKKKRIQNIKQIHVEPQQKYSLELLRIHRRGPSISSVPKQHTRTDGPTRKSSITPKYMQNFRNNLK